MLTSLRKPSESSQQLLTSVIIPAALPTPCAMGTVTLRQPGSARLAPRELTAWPG